MFAAYRGIDDDRQNKKMKRARMRYKKNIKADDESRIKESGQGQNARILDGFSDKGNSTSG